MPIYCVVMSDVKQESLANVKVRISSQQQCNACVKAPRDGKSTQGT